MPDSYARVLRRNDYSLDEQQQAVFDTFSDFFRAVSPSEVVRAADPLGFDRGVWKKALSTGVVSMAVPESRGGDGATLVDLALVAEQYGATLAPIPLVESATTARLLSTLPEGAVDAILSDLLTDRTIVTLALRTITDAPRQLVPAGAIAGIAIALDGEDLVAVSAPPDVRHEQNHGAAPIAWWNLAAPGVSRQVLASGLEAVKAYTEAVRTWKLLTASALAGSGGAAVHLAVDFAVDRTAFGQSIATFQGISHALVDASILVEASRNLARKAAWYAEYEPDEERQLIPSAFLSASRAAVKASTVAVHVQGGFGFTNESDVTLHFVRAKGWSLLAGRPVDELLAVAEVLPLPASI